MKPSDVVTVTKLTKNPPSSFYASQQEFLQFYVAHKIPDTGFLRTLAGPVVLGLILSQGPC